MIGRSDKFALWLKDLGTGHAAEVIGVTDHMVRLWRDRKCAPRPDKALICIRLSKELFGWKEIYEPFALKKIKNS